VMMSNSAQTLNEPHEQIDRQSSVKAEENRHSAKAEGFWGDLGDDIKDGLDDIGNAVKAAAQGVEKFVDGAKCIICEDGAKLLGYIGTAIFEDDDGIGEAEAAMIEAIKVTTDEQVKNDIAAAQRGGVCAAATGAIASLITDIDSNYNESALHECLSQVCGFFWNSILKTYGQSLLGQFLSIAAATACGCPKPDFDKCTDILIYKKPQPCTPQNSAVVAAKNRSQILAEEDAETKMRLLIQASAEHGNKAKANLLSYETTSIAEMVTPFSKACQINEFKRKTITVVATGSAAEKQCGKTETFVSEDEITLVYGAHECVSDMDCQGSRTCQVPEGGITPTNVGRCYGNAVECCGSQSIDQCPEEFQIEAIPFPQRNAIFMPDLHESTETMETLGRTFLLDQQAWVESFNNECWECSNYRQYGCNTGSDSTDQSCDDRESTCYADPYTTVPMYMGPVWNPFAIQGYQSADGATSYNYPYVNTSWVAIVDWNSMAFWPPVPCVNPGWPYSNTTDSTQTKCAYTVDSAMAALQQECGQNGAACTPNGGYLHTKYSDLSPDHTKCWCPKKQTFSQTMTYHSSDSTDSDFFPTSSNTGLSTTGNSFAFIYQCSSDAPNNSPCSVCRPVAIPAYPPPPSGHTYYDDPID